MCLVSWVSCLLYVDIRRGVAHACYTRGMYSVVSGRPIFQHGAGIEVVEQRQRSTNKNSC